MKKTIHIITRFFFFCSIIFSQWSTNSAEPQSIGTGIQAQAASTSDGGLYVAWLSDGSYHVYLQYLNPLGEPQLGDGGMVVSNNQNASWIAVYHLNLAVDHEGNAIISTVDQRAGGVWEVYAYKVGSDGAMHWGDNGLTLSNSSTSNMSPRIAISDNNSVTVTWTHNDNSVLFQHISSAGTLLWGDGIQITENNATLISPNPISTSDNNILIQWIRQTGPFWAANSELYLQKYDHDGNTLWSNPVVAAGPVVFPMGNWAQQSLPDANGGSFSGWTEMSGNVQNAGVQHTGADGNLLWAGGVDLSDNTSHFRTSPKLAVTENNQDLIAVWNESNGAQSQRGVYAQRVDSDGNKLWGSNGVPVIELNGGYDYLDLSVHSLGDDVISSYIEQTVSMSGDIYATKLNQDGSHVWTNSRIAITNSGTSKSDLMTAGGPDCLFILWTENGSVYGHCLRSDGSFGPPDVGPWSGPVWHVANTGSDDSGDGSVGSPFATIQKGVDSASDNNTVLVSPGTYTENINWSMANNVRLIGFHMDSSIIDGGGIGKVIDNSDETSHPIEISNFTIQNGISTGKGGGISLKMVGNLLLKNIKVDNNHAQIGGGVYIEGEGSASFVPTVVHFENTIISNNSADTYGGGVSLSGAIISSIMKSVTIVNNSAVNGGGGLSAGSMGDYAIIANSIFWNNQPTNADGMIFPYYSNIDIPIGTNNIFTDPLFVSGDPNFNLSDGSPCIDAGTDFLVIDLSNEMLPGDVPDTVVSVNSQSYNGIGPDMGALESTYSSVEICDANDGTVGVELWSECYSIENTTIIQLYNAELNSAIPAEIGNLVNLNNLRLEHCGLVGEIPIEIGSLSNLLVLSLNNNQLEGAIPSEIGSLTNLTSLSLNNNSLGQQIPVEIFNLINLSGNNVGPGGLGWIPGLDLSNNLLTGVIPPGINSLENIKSINLENNMLSGEPLLEMCSLINLRSLDLSDNQFSGQIPAQIGDLINLTGFFTGHAPAITLHPGLDISNNQFSGIIPSSICSNWNNPTGISGFNFSGNQFCEPLPYCIDDYIIGTQDDSNCPQVFNQMVFVEDMTADESCPYCGVGSLTMNNLLRDNPDQLISIQWQAWDTDNFTPDDCQYGLLGNCSDIRLNYYAVTGIPTEVFNGTGLVVGADVSWDNYARYDSAFQSLVSNVSEYNISISGSRTESTINYEVGVTNDNDPTMLDYYVHVFLVEDSILTTWSYQDNSDSLDFARNVVRLWLTDSVANENDDEIQNFTGSFEIDSSLWNLNQMKITSIIQNKNTNEVYQAAQKHINTLEFLEIKESGLTDNLIIPRNYNLFQNHPNPFNPVTSLRYDLPENGLVNIAIYDMMGRIVKTLVSSSQTAGYKSIRWNATNDRNEPVSAGLYLYTIQAGKFRQTKKMVLLK